MQPPESAEIFTTPISEYWFVGDIMYVNSRPGQRPPLEIHKKQSEEFISQLKGRKLCAVIDISNASPTPADHREYNQKVLPEIFKAIAFVTSTALGKMLINLYLGLKPITFPTKVFSNEKEASDWVKQFT